MVLGEIPFASKRSRQMVVAIVVQQQAKLLSSGIVGVLQKLSQDSSTRRIVTARHTAKQDPTK